MQDKPRVHRVERNLFRLGVFLLVGEAAFLVIMAIVRPVVFGKLVALISALLVAGRLGAISAGLGMRFRTLELICFLSLFDLMWLLLFYSLVVKLSGQMAADSFIGRMVLDTHKIARNQQRKVARFGSLGLALFVWLPFPWTGPVIASMIGLLMGMTTERIMLVILPSMLVSITGWTLGFRYLFDVSTQLRKLFSAVLALCVILLALLLRFRRVRRRVTEQDKPQPGENRRG